MLINGILKDEFGFQGIVRLQYLEIRQCWQTLGNVRLASPDQRCWFR
jgi:hypothetical protein